MAIYKCSKPVRPKEARREEDRHRNDDHLVGQEGAFVTCSFWLAECLAHQGRMQEARELFDRVASCGSDLGLFPEEYDSDRRELLGNFPQGLSHLSHIAAAVALAQPYGPGSAVAQHAFGAGQPENQQLSPHRRPQAGGRSGHRGSPPWRPGRRTVLLRLR